MLSSIQASPSFTSTKITMSKQDINMLLHKTTDKYLDTVEKHYKLRAAMENFNRKPATPQMVADNIQIGEAAVKINGNEITVYGKDKVSDSYIGKLLTKLFPQNAKFAENIK